MRLHYVATSPYARIIRMMIIEAGLSEQVELVETLLRDPKSPLLPVNPVGRVPTLELDDGTALTETLLVARWLDGRHGGRPLYGGDAAHLARLGLAMGTLDGMAVWVRELRRPENERSPGVIALERDRAARCFDAIERRIADFGGPVDVAALVLASLVGFTDLRNKAFDWRAGRPGLAAWFETMAERASVARTEPPA